MVEWRFVGGQSEQYHDSAAELVRLKVDAIVTASGDEPIIAAMNVTKTVPIIILTGSDPVARGFVASLTRPGGNVTGISYMLHELNGKRLELIKEVVPKLFRVAVLGDRVASKLQRADLDRQYSLHSEHDHQQERPSWKTQPLVLRRLTG